MYYIFILPSIRINKMKSRETISLLPAMRGTFTNGSNEIQRKCIFKIISLTKHLQINIQDSCTSLCQCKVSSVLVYQGSGK